MKSVQSLLFFKPMKEPPTVFPFGPIAELVVIPKRPYRPGEKCYVPQFRPIVFGDGSYAACDDGNIYNISKGEPRRKAVKFSHNGYEEVFLFHHKKRYRFRVNRLICKAFYGNPHPHETECRHMDGDKRNNLPENLDWGTRRQNAQDAAASGTFKKAQIPVVKLSDKDVEDIRNSTDNQFVLAERYGVCQPTISKIRSGKKRKPLPPQPPRNRPIWAARRFVTILSCEPMRVSEVTEEDAIRLGFTFDEYNQVMARENFENDWHQRHPGTWAWRVESEGNQG